MSTWLDDENRVRDRYHKENLKLLIWGPGKPEKGSSNKFYDKRVQMKEILREKFPFAEVYFSEDQEMRDLSKDIIGELNKEAYQAKIADAIIILLVSRGSNLELDYFVPKYDWFPKKTYILIEEKYHETKGLVKDVLERLKPDQIIPFTEKELDECKVAKGHTLRFAKTIACMRYLDS
ncbi:MAG: hypothetical protein WD512_13720 [Candidatus Paceibacterota bacterium]